MALTAELKQYHQGVLALRQSQYLNWPAHVHLETLAQCNAACSFCPYPVLQRQGEKMPDALIEKVLQDLTAIPRGLPFQLSPFKVNEPFLDNRLFDILGAINHKLPNASITLTTNSTPITAKKLAQLAQVKKLGYLWISVNGHREVEYEKTMVLPYKRTMERLDMIHAAKSRGELPFRVVLSRVGDGTAADTEFVAWMKQRFALFETAVFQRGGWIGQVDVPQIDVPDVGCMRWFELSITATGVVAHCCMDGQAAYPLGDVNTQHVLDIYNAPAYRQLRERQQSRLGAAPCNQCCFL